MFQAEDGIRDRSPSRGLGEEYKRQFLNKCPNKKEFRCHACQPGTLDNMIFTSAVGELRGVFGVMIGQIAKAYGIDVEDELADIIPE